MPYIDQNVRDELNFQGATPKFPGELNYKISILLDQYIADCGLNYTVLNEVIGVLECAKMEIYRRVVAPYEDVKLCDNGEVYKNVIGLLPEQIITNGTKDGSAKMQKAVIEIVPTSGAKYGETKFDK